MTAPDEIDGTELSTPYKQLLHEVDPHLLKAQDTWLSAIESLEHLDRRTTELIRLAVATILRHDEACARHAQLAHEAGASWQEVLSALVLTQPAFGVLPAAAAYPHARAGFDRAQEPEADE